MSGPNDTPKVQNLAAKRGENRLRAALLNAANMDADRAQQKWDALPDNAPEKMAGAAFFARTETQYLRMARRARADKAPRLFLRTLRAAAAVVLVCAVSLGTAMAVSAEIRAAVLRLVYRVTPQYTEISIDGVKRVYEEGKATPAADGQTRRATVPPSMNVPDGWTGNYYPSYIPEGYVFHSITGTPSMRISIYMSASERIMYFDEDDLTVEANIDTEGYKTEEININGNTALLAYKEGKTTIVWQEPDRILTLMVDENVETALKVVESVQRIK